jgi:hypothetical protein
MMKHAWIAAAVWGLTVPALAQVNPRGEAKAMVGGKSVTIEYGRPSLKGRDMLAQAEVGKPWRVGADDATSLKTEADLAFGTVDVPKGEYILTATKVSADQWHLNVLGKADRSKVAEIPLVSSALGQSIELFTIDLEGEKNNGSLSLAWGTTALKASFTGK